MTYINKKFIFALLAINSCAHIDYREVYTYAKTSIVGVDDIIIDKDYYLYEDKSSFIKVRLGKRLVATLVLANVENNIFEWVGSNNEKIITKNGRIIETLGLSHNMEVINLYNINLNLDSKKELLITLRDPQATISQSIQSYDLGQQIIELDKTFIAQSYREDFITHDYKWSGSNFYWVDTASSLPIKTVSSTHPYLDAIEIEFYYTFTRD